MQTVAVKHIWGLEFLGHKMVFLPLSIWKKISTSFIFLFFYLSFILLSFYLFYLLLSLSLSFFCRLPYFKKIFHIFLFFFLFDSVLFALKDNFTLFLHVFGLMKLSTFL